MFRRALCNLNFLTRIKQWKSRSFQKVTTDYRATIIEYTCNGIIAQKLARERGIAFCCSKKKYARNTALKRAHTVITNAQIEGFPWNLVQSREESGT